MDPPCKITRLDCDDPAQKAEVSKLADKADLQIGSFESIFPWLTRCDLASRHYVAKKDDNTICGWMSVNARKKGNQTFFYLSEISVIRTPDPSFKGVGLRLHQTLVEEAKKEGKDFIYLYPLNEKVKATYTSDKWGYRSLPGDPEHLYYVVAKDPTPSTMNMLKPKAISPRLYTARAYDVARNLLKNDVLTKLVQDRRRSLFSQLRKPENKALLENLKNTLDTIEQNAYVEEDYQLSEEELKDALQDAILAIPYSPSQGGTRRLRKRRQTRRKRTRRV